MRLAVFLSVALSLFSLSARAAAVDADQPVQTMRNGLPSVSSAQTDDGPTKKPGSASAFQRDRNVSVAERPHPEYQALGLRAGAFMIYPKVTETISYDDNIFASSTDGVSDWIFQTTAAMSAVSNWSRNALDAHASVTASDYAHFGALNTTDYDVGANGRLDVVGNSNIYGGVQTGRYTIPFTSLAVPSNAATPEQYLQTAGDIGAVQELNRVRLTERFDIANYHYENLRDTTGGVIVEDGQNHTSYSEQARAEYALTPDTAGFVSAKLNQRNYQASSNQGVTSHGFEVTAGANFDVTHLIRGEIQLGYLQQNFNASAASGFPKKSVTGPAFHAKVEWFPSQLTTVTATANREVADYTIAGASGTLISGGGLQIDHELLRNVIIGASANYNQLEYVGAGRTDNAWTVGGQGTYLLNRHLGLQFAYRHIDQSSSSANLKFTDNRASLAAVFQY